MYDANLGLERVIIEPGEYHTAATPRAITTVLGSCVSVCLKCNSCGVAGMNHFMLPAAVREDRLFVDDAARYGIQAMELLINELLLRGARRDTLQAKVFGAAHVLGFNGVSADVPKSNGRFALGYLEMEGIPVAASDLGGSRGRRIMFLTQTGQVRVRRLQETLVEQVGQRERDLLRRIRARPSGAIRVFVDKEIP